MEKKGHRKKMFVFSGKFLILKGKRIHVSIFISDYLGSFIPVFALGYSQNHGCLEDAL